LKAADDRGSVAGNKGLLSFILKSSVDTNECDNNFYFYTEIWLNDGNKSNISCAICNCQNIQKECDNWPAHFCYY